MADGSITIKIDVDGKEIDGASSSLKGLAKDAQSSGKETKKASVGIKEIAVSLGLVSIASKAFDVMASSMDRAVSRFDTLNAFPKVMEGLGVETEIADQAINKIANNLEGTSGYLDDVSLTAQRMYTSLKDLDKSADTALALQRAFDASGASADEAGRGTEQYIQALQKGNMEMDEWKTLQQTMSVGLYKIAEDFGMTESELYSALQSGQISMNDFNDKLIEVGSATGELADLARTNSGGIAKSFSYLQSSVSTGMANILTSVNALVKEVTGKEIEDHLNNLRGVINFTFRAIGASVEASAPFFIMFGKVISGLIPVVSTLSPLIIGLSTAYASFVIIQKVNSWYTGFQKVLEGTSVVTALLTKQMNGQTVAQLAKASATKADTVAMLLNTKSLTLGQVALGFLTGNLTLSTVATLAKAKAVVVLNGVLTALSGPIGWIIAGITALTVAGVALYKWITRSTEEGKQLNAQNKELAESTSELTSKVDDSANSYENSIKSIEGSAQANKDLLEQTMKIYEQDIKSNAEKKLLEENIEQLNRQVDGLSLAYDAESDSMNSSSEQIERRIELMEEQEKGAEAQERLLEISKEQHEVDMQLTETNALRQELNEKQQEGAITGREYKNELADLAETEEELQEREAMLGDQYTETAEVRTEAMEKVVSMTEEGVADQLLMYDQLSEGNKQLVDNLTASYEDIASAGREMYEVMAEDHEMSVAQMTENMEENQRVISDWADNIAELAERGISDGLIQELIDGGPESAGLVKELKESSDAEIEGYDLAFQESGETAISALKTALGEGSDEVVEAVGHLVTGTEESMRSQMANADFENIGLDVSKGLASGVESGAGEAIDASGQMADDMTQKTRDTLQTNSPSRVYKDIGEDVTSGLALGINSGTSNVMKAIREMFNRLEGISINGLNDMLKRFDTGIADLESSLSKLSPIAQRAMAMMLRSLRSGTNANVMNMQDGSRRIVSAYNGLPSQLQAVGSNAMSGMIRGMNSRRSAVTQTARSIANSVASTMQRALEIRSPSQKMEREVGRWIPEGLADGMEKGLGTIDRVVDKMTQSVMNVGTPEMALGGASLGGVNYAKQRTGKAVSSGSTTNTSNSYVVNIDTIENHTDEDIPRILEESVWVMGRKDRGRLYE